MEDYDPLRELRRLQNEMKRLFEEYAQYPLERRKLPGLERRDIVPRARVPVAEVVETDKDIIARIEIPGVNKKDVQLSITEDSLEVKVEKKEEAHIEKEGLARVSRSYRSFYRRIPFPVEVVAEKAKAHYDNGVLEVTAPKVHENKKGKKIDIE